MGKRLLLVAAAILAGCAPARTDWHKDFDESRAWAHLKKQVEFGPRPAGSEAAKLTAEYLESELRRLGLKVVCQEFDVADTPRGRVTFRNVLATTGAWPPRRDAVILASHYDTKQLAGKRFVGANDAASSTACLLELARVLAPIPMKEDCIFVFFDGEEAFERYSEHDGLFGSRHLAAGLKTSGHIERLRALILLDMVGDANLRITMPTGDPDLQRSVFAAAEKLGVRDRFSLLGAPMLDDHVPFLELGVPTVDLIDFEFGPSNAYWHTEEDSLERVSPASLGIVGRTVLRMLEDRRSGR